LCVDIFHSMTNVSSVFNYSPTSTLDHLQSVSEACYRLLLKKRLLVQPNNICFISFFGYLHNNYYYHHLYCSRHHTFLGLLLWCISVSNIHDKLQHCPKMASNLILIQKSRTLSVQNFMERLHWLPVSSWIDFKIATRTYNSVFWPSGQPSRSLHSSNQLLLTVPHARLTTGQLSMLSPLHPPIIWNDIPLSVSDALSFSTFKCCQKSSYFTPSSPNLRHLVSARASNSTYIQLFCAL